MPLERPVHFIGAEVVGLEEERDDHVEAQEGEKNEERAEEKTCEDSMILHYAVHIDISHRPS